MATVDRGLARPARASEIGSGKGLCLQLAAQANPDRHYLGIELAAKLAHRAADRLARSSLGNVTMLRGDARRFLAETVPTGSLERVHVYFPDPWWRNKHKKRRVLNEQTLQDIQRVLIPGGEFHFWTDVLDYYEHICTQVMHQTQLAPALCASATSRPRDGLYNPFRTPRALSDQPVYRAIFVRPGTGTDG